MHIQKVLELNKAQQRTDLPDFQPGDTISVNVRIKEGEKQRIQAFEGIVLRINKRNAPGGNFTVRKVTSGVGVERTFLFNSSNIDKITVKQMGKVRRAKLYYIRGLSAKKARIKSASRSQQEKRNQSSEGKPSSTPQKAAPAISTNEITGVE